MTSDEGWERPSKERFKKSIHDSTKIQKIMKKNEFHSTETHKAFKTIEEIFWHIFSVLKSPAIFCLSLTTQFYFESQNRGNENGENKNYTRQ